MSNPFLTNDPMEDIKPTVPLDVFGIAPSDPCATVISKRSELKSNNPFIMCDDNLATNLFDSADSGIHSKDLFVSNDDVSAAPAEPPDLFGFDDAGKKVPDNPFGVTNAVVGEVKSPGDPFGPPVEQDGFSDVIVDAAEPGSNSLRIDVSKLDFFNTKGAVSPGVSPRHSPILEQKDFEPVPPMGASFLSDAMLDNLSEDSLNLQAMEITDDTIADIDVNEREGLTNIVADDQLDPFGAALSANESSKDVTMLNGDVGDIPSIKLTSSDNQPHPVNTTNADDEVGETDDIFGGGDLMSSDVVIKAEDAGTDKAADGSIQAFASNDAFNAFAAKFESASVTMVSLCSFLRPSFLFNYDKANCRPGLTSSQKY